MLPPPGLPPLEGRALGLEEEIRVALQAALAASGILQAHFRDLPPSEAKVDGELVSAADRDADRLIRATLGRSFPDDALLTEETPDDGHRLETRRVWIVDPLDGTRDFLEGSSEFAVHIALVEDGRPLLGLVHRPSSGRTWLGVPGGGAWVGDGSVDAWTTIRVAEPLTPWRIALTRRMLGPAVEALLRRLPSHVLVRSGSSGLKGAMVGDGRCELYAGMTSRMKEWDLCAPHAVVEAAGGRAVDLRGEPLSYNRPDVRARRGFLATTPALLHRLMPILDALPDDIPWLR
jgi:3'(2'), 5'-bisphosphate nucleotidase